MNPRENRVKDRDGRHYGVKPREPDFTGIALSTCILGYSVNASVGAWSANCCSW